MTKPLAESRIGVVTTGGLYRAGVDAPFDDDAPDGVPIQTLAIAHAHFPTTWRKPT